VIKDKIAMDSDREEDQGPDEVLGGGTYAPNARTVLLEQEAYLESLKQFKHVQPRIGKETEHILSMVWAYSWQYRPHFIMRKCRGFSLHPRFCIANGL